MRTEGEPCWGGAGKHGTNVFFILEGRDVNYIPNRALALIISCVYASGSLIILLQ
jgi:hypothetical protein